MTKKTNQEENSQPQPTVQDLKAAAYDLISQRERIDQRLGQINRAVREREQSETRNHPNDDPEAPPENESEEE